MAKKPAYALATILILLGIAMFGAGALITVSSLESKISLSEKEGVTAYYVAEAGVQNALWKLQNTYTNQLANGSLSNVTYTINNVPDTGESFTVILNSTPANGAGTGTIDVVGTSNNGTFTAQRHITDTVFQGQPVTVIGANAVLTGSTFTVNNAGPLSLSGGNLYSTGSISVNNMTANLGANLFQTLGNYGATNSTITSGGYNDASHNPPPAQAVPGFDFSTCTASSGGANCLAARATGTYYTNTNFQNAIKNAENAIVFSGPVTYVDGDVTMSAASFANKTITVKGILVINGNFTVSPSNASSLTVTTDSNGKGGLFIKNALSSQKFSYTVNGLLYTGGAINMNNLPGAISINGALVSAGSVSFNNAGAISVTYNGTTVSNTLGGGTPSVVTSSHWEDKY